jgi:hypothetical protein
VIGDWRGEAPERANSVNREKGCSADISRVCTDQRVPSRYHRPARAEGVLESGRFWECQSAGDLFRSFASLALRPTNHQSLITFHPPGSWLLLPPKEEAAETADLEAAVAR